MWLPNPFDSGYIYREWDQMALATAMEDKDSRDPF